MLVALYEAADGPNWKSNTNWLSDRPLAEWSGVTTDRDGRVTELALPNNGLTGAIPPQLANLSNLRKLWLDSNELTGPIPPQLAKLSSLYTLSLTSNRLTGVLPSSLRALTALRRFSYDRNAGLCVPDDAPFQAWLNTIGGVYGDRCPGTADPAMSSASRDRAALVAIYNATDGPNWKNSTNWLSERPLSEWYGVATDSAGSVIGLRLSQNKLRGPVPPQLAGLSNLRELWLGGNQLSGSIPLQLANLSNLLLLLLYANELTGPVPSQLGNLSNLNELDLSRNQLTGTIPPQLANLSFLLGLWLGKNELMGPVPVQLADLANLRLLRLESNQLTGSLPSSLTRLTGLENVQFYDNAGLCAPTDVEFQAWLRGIAWVQGDTCP